MPKQQPQTLTTPQPAGTFGGLAPGFIELTQVAPQVLAIRVPKPPRVVTLGVTVIFDGSVTPYTGAPMEIPDTVGANMHGPLPGNFQAESLPTGSFHNCPFMVIC